MSFNKKIDSKKNQLYAILGSETVDKLIASNAMLAGGALTSLFTNTDINDFDLYFRDKNDLAKFIAMVYGSEDLANMFSGEEENESTAPVAPSIFGKKKISFIDVLDDCCPFDIVCRSMTDRSILMTNGDQDLQAIFFRFFENASDIFESFDFTINMVAFDFSTEEFVFHDDFFIDLGSKSLCINTKTDYPIITLLRVEKYSKRGYKMSKKEHFKLAMAINKLSITSWEEMKDQLSGFYGLKVDDIFNEEEDFSMENAIEMLTNVEVLPFERIQPYSEQEIINHLFTKFGAELPQYFYKVLDVSGDDYVSPCYKDFKWDLRGKNNGGEYGLWMYTTKERAINSTWNCKDTVVVKLRVEDPSLIQWHDIRQNVVVAKGNVFIEELYMNKK